MTLINKKYGNKILRPTFIKKKSFGYYKSLKPTVAVNMFCLGFSNSKL